MKRILVAVIAMSVAVVAVDSSAAPAPEDAIKQAFGRLDGCLAENDATCIGDLFVEDGTFSEPVSGGKIVKGKAQIVKVLKDLFSGSPTMKGAKRTHSVGTLRMIGEDHALVDSAVAVAEPKGAGGGADATPNGGFHAVGLLVLKGDKWMFKDLRSYAVGASVPAKSATTVTSLPPATVTTTTAAK